MRNNLKRVLAVVLSFVLMLSFLIANDVNVYAATKKVTKVEVTNLKKKNLTINKGQKKTLSVKVTTTGKKISTDFTVKSSNTKVATVKKSGKKVIISAKKNGKANITITSKADKKKKTVVKVTVVTPVKKVTMNTSKATVKLGKTLQLKATVSSDASNKSLKWTSSNSGVATVNSKGVVTAKKAGKATITAMAQDGSKKKATCVITVNDTNSIKSVKVIESLIVEVELEYPQKLTKANFAVHNKLMSKGNYVAGCDIEAIETSDDKKYYIYLYEYIALDSFVRVSISGLKGVSTQATKEITYTRETKVLTDEIYVKLTCGNECEYSIVPEYNEYGYWTFTNTALPAGLKVEAKGAYTAFVSGTPSKSGIYNTTFTFTDEVGNVEKIKVNFVIGDTNTLTATTAPMYGVTQANGVYGLDRSISKIVYVTGGSGNYSYEIVGNKYGLAFDSSNYLEGTFYNPGTYKINIKITDKNNTNLTKTVVWTINLKQGITVSGIVKDATGQGMTGVYVDFINVDDNNMYNSYSYGYDYDYGYSDSTGAYAAVVPAGTYDVIVYNEYMQTKYAGRKTVTTSESGFDIVMPLYKVVVYPDNTKISKFGTWYDGAGQPVGSGAYLYLRAGTHTLKTEGTCFEGKYTAVLNITVAGNRDATAKVKIQQVQRETITLGQTKSTKINNEYTYYKFVPTETGTYYFYSTSSYDTYGAIYDKNGTMITSKDGGGKGSNFEISYKFIAGETYYLAARKYSGSLFATVSVTVSTTSSTATS
ncbi:MAG: hypothetical protein E7270_00490 [Lachnospiraceae bacterium]|nr:hypothetical protein [Lachnospiraceae bacterium]